MVAALAVRSDCQRQVGEQGGKQPGFRVRAPACVGNGSPSNGDENRSLLGVRVLLPMASMLTFVPAETDFRH